jgi:hypothetical protein
MTGHENKTHMDTQAQVIDELVEAGYTENLRIDDDGRIRSSTVDWSSEEVVVTRTARFEGMSNPDDEAVVFALSGPDGRMGTLSLPYGPDATGAQADTMRALTIAARAAQPSARSVDAGRRRPRA